VVTFGVAYTNAPNCFLYDNTDDNVPVSSTAGNTLTVTVSAASKHYNYACLGPQA